MNIPDWWPNKDKEPYIIGNCIDKMPKLPAGCVDLILTDPPYGIDYHSNHYVDKNPNPKLKGDDVVWTRFITHAWRLLKETGAMVVFTSQAVEYEWFKALQSYNIRNKVVWVKNNWSAGDLKQSMGRQYEVAYFCVKPGFSFPNKRPSDVYRANREPPIGHGTVKPKELFKDLINDLCPENGIVLDPFLGSGTTILSTRMAGKGRIGLGIEIDKTYEGTIINKIGDIDAIWND